MEYAVKFDRVYKEYPFYAHITAGFKSFLFNMPKNIASLGKTRFIALREISFDVRRGETLGIIGRNGSGKSTILGLIAGVIRQDRGEVKTTGRISSLLELGAGFHPDLSGIENIILNGILMGNTREEMLGKVDEIIAFSEIGDFIYQPLRTYSSGMYVRLGFSVAVHVEPEILLVDEALAVGDIKFQEKCLRKMSEFKKAGVTIILVSHDMTPIAQLCDTVAWIEGGSLRAQGRPGEVIPRYLAYLGQEAPPSFSEEVPGPEEEHESNNREPEGAVQTQPPQVAEPFKTWWDYPPAIRFSEELITGSEDVNFYEYLEREHMTKPADRGLCICNKLKGIDNNFVTFNLCRSFDTIGTDNLRSKTPSEVLELKRERYDLFLTVDALHYISDLRSFLSKIKDAMKRNAVVVALEYIGPERFDWPDKERSVAERILSAVRGKASPVQGRECGLQSRSMVSRTGNGFGSVSSRDVIPLLEGLFDVRTIRYFGGPLQSLVIDDILSSGELHGDDEEALIRALMEFEQILLKEGVVQNSHAVIIGQKKA